MAPSAYTSAAVVRTLSPRACSGGMYEGGPTMAPDWVGPPPPSTRLARPKSVTRGAALASRRMLAGLEDGANAAAGDPLQQLVVAEVAPLRPGGGAGGGSPLGGRGLRLRGRRGIAGRGRPVQQAGGVVVGAQQGFPPPAQGLIAG